MRKRDIETQTKNKKDKRSGGRKIRKKRECTDRLKMQKKKKKKRRGRSEKEEGE